MKKPPNPITIILYLIIYSILLLYQMGIGNPFSEEISPVITLFLFWIFGVLSLIAFFKEKKQKK